MENTIPLPSQRKPRSEPPVRVWGRGERSATAALERSLVEAAEASVAGRLEAALGCLQELRRELHRGKTRGPGMAKGRS